MGVIFWCADSNNGNITHLLVIMHLKIFLRNLTNYIWSEKGKWLGTTHAKYLPIFWSFNYNMYANFITRYTQMMSTWCVVSKHNKIRIFRLMNGR